MEQFEFELWDHKFRWLEARLNEIIAKEIKIMAHKIMAQIDDLNTAIAAEDVDVQTIAASATKIAADITALKALVAAGASPTVLTTQIDSILAHSTSLATAAGILQAADKDANTP